MKGKVATLTLWLCLLITTVWCAVDVPDCKKRKHKSQHELIEGVNEAACEHYLSVCAIFQDEARWLKEWLEFHRMVGVQHFYLYNNNSTDHYSEVLEPYIQMGVVDLFDWPSAVEELLYCTQVQVYNHCINLCIGHTRWLAIIDIDEFMCPVSKPDLPSYLKQYDSNKGVGGIMAFWQMYGTSWIGKLGDDELLTERMITKAPTYDACHHQVKTICKPHKVHRYDVHGAHYKAGYWDMTTNGYGGPHQPIQLDHLRVNHYWARDDDFLVNVKKPRREKCEGAVWTDETLNHYRHWMNTEFDHFMDRFVPELRKRVFSTN
jgi:hypothetical protein